MKAARVQFLIPLPEPFDYEIPEGEVVVAGQYVMAPVGPNQRLGVIWEVVEDDGSRALKPISHVFDAPPMPEATRQFVSWAARYTCAPVGSFLRMVVRSLDALKPSPVETRFLATGERPARMTPARERVLEVLTTDSRPQTQKAICETASVSAGVIKGLEEAGAVRRLVTKVDQPFRAPDSHRKGPALSEEQASAALEVRGAVARGVYAPILLDGVTGSGKTEVYFEAIAEALAASDDAQVLVLLPEIALTQAIMARFSDRFGAAPAQWHSGLSQKARRRAWREVATGRARIVVGARSALFLPYPALKLIVVDEEHDGSFKQEENGTYHARDLAVARARFEQATVILASATPALETLSNAESGRFGHLRLRERIGTARLPDVSLVDLRDDRPAAGEWLSQTLRTALEETYGAGEQSLLFLNRRGYAPLVLCAACGDKLKTPGTESWLTEHRYSGRLVCHLTGFSMPKPRKCPKCGAEGSLRGVGPGVERVAEDVRKLLPQARIEIFSSDTAQTGQDISGVVSRMAAGEIDVLVGTQIVAKGHNFPGLTLVGVVDADSGLKGGDLRAGERTYQLLSQVAGRAGRAERPGRALLQTYDPENPIMEALAAQDRDSFIEAERMGREAIGFPPFGRLAAVVLSAAQEREAEVLARDVAASAPNAHGVKVFGPAPAPISVLRGRWRWRLLVQADRRVDLSAYMAAWRGQMSVRGSGRVTIDIDPYTFL